MKKFTFEVYDKVANKTEIVELNERNITNARRYMKQVYNSKYYEVREVSSMFEAVKKFMHQEDRNGDWLEANEEEKGYMHNTLLEWLEDGLERTKRVEGYLSYLKK